MFHFFAPAGRYFFPHIPEISISLIACLLVLLGNDINRLLRKITIRQHFVIRTFIFIVVNAFGYGMIIVKLSPYLSTWLRTLDTGTLFVAIVVGFIVIGMWAQKNRHV